MLIVTLLKPHLGVEAEKKKTAFLVVKKKTGPLLDANWWEEGEEVVP